MNRWLKTICLLLAVLLAMQSTVLTASATELDDAVKNAQSASMQFDMSGENAEQTETQAVETEVPETAPATEETVPPTEAVPEEPAVPEETQEPVQPQETQPPVETVPVEAGEDPFSRVPLYLQTDYPNTMYGAGSVATSGCSITCLAMVATYLTGHEYLPDELARYFGGTAENNIARLENGSKALQLPFYKAKNWHYTLDALQEGKVAIILMECDSLFTLTQHFIVVTGMTEDGKFVVNDPYQPNYDKWNLKNAFLNGFDEGDILKGYSSAWIYDKSAMPEEPFIYSEPEIDKSNCRYPGVELTLDELRLLARVVWVEARGECEEGQQAVAEVVFNRMTMEGYPDSLEDVIYAEGQFRSVPYLDDAEPYQAQYDAIEKALYGPYVLPKDVVLFAGTATNEHVWGRIGGHVFCYDWDYTGESE